jgi:hypothetical protein
VLKIGDKNADNNMQKSAKRRQKGVIIPLIIGTNDLRVTIFDT